MVIIFPQEPKEYKAFSQVNEKKGIPILLCQKKALIPLQ